MKIKLSEDDYASVSAIAGQKLGELIPNTEFTHANIIFGPEFMAVPLRISTPYTGIKFDTVHKEYVKNLRQEIKTSNTTDQEKHLKMRHLESIILFGQLLFSQSASLHFLHKDRYRSHFDDSPNLDLQLEQLQELVQKESIQYASSKFEALSRRKEFNEFLATIKKAIKEMPLNEEDRKLFLSNLNKAKGFYYQANDFNFNYANKPSRSYSKFLNNCEYFGSKIAFGASLIAIGATALALIPPLAPVMIPIAFVASAIAFSFGVPIALKKLGTMLYNLIKFGAAPTPGELINAATIGLGVVLAGSGHAIGGLINAGFGQYASVFNQSIQGVMNTGKITFGFKGEIDEANAQKKLNRYKFEVENLRSTQESLEEPLIPKPNSI